MAGDRHHQAPGGAHDAAGGVHLRLGAQSKIWGIGFLGTASASGFARRVEALREGLRDLGYVEGKNLVRRWRKDVLTQS